MNIIYEALVGSHAYGLATPESDRDIRGVFLFTAREHWSLDRPKDELHPEGGDDKVYWEAEKFIRLLLKQNPTALEVLWAAFPNIQHPVMSELWWGRRRLLSRQVYLAYRGFAQAQRTSLLPTEKIDEIDWKAVMHAMRLMNAGLRALVEGEIMVYVEADHHRQLFLDVREGLVPPFECMAWLDATERAMQKAYDQTTLPKEPDRTWANDILYQLRRSAV